MDSGTSIFISSMAAAFVVGTLFAGAIMAGHAGAVVERVRTWLRDRRKNDEPYESAPWRDM